MHIIQFDQIHYNPSALNAPTTLSNFIYFFANTLSSNICTHNECRDVFWSMAKSNRICILEENWLFPLPPPLQRPQSTLGSWLVRYEDMPTVSRNIPRSRDAGLYKMKKWDEMNTFLYLSPFANYRCGVTSCFKLLLSWLFLHNGLYFKPQAKNNLFLFIKKICSSKFHVYFI